MDRQCAKSQEKRFIKIDQRVRTVHIKRFKGRVQLFVGNDREATERHPPYGITHCCLLTDTRERALP